MFSDSRDQIVEASNFEFDNTYLLQCCFITSEEVNIAQLHLKDAVHLYSLQIKFMSLTIHCSTCFRHNGKRLLRVGLMNAVLGIEWTVMTGPKLISSNPSVFDCLSERS